MIKIARPRTDEQKTELLQHTFDRAQYDAQQGVRHVKEETLQHIQEFLPRYKDAADELTMANTTLKGCKSDLAAAIYVMKRAVRDRIRYLRKQVDRNEAPAKVLTYYHLPRGGRLRFPTNQKAWMRWAARLVRGDELVQRSGDVPIEINHSVDMAYREVLERLDAVDVANASLVPPKQACVALRKEGAELCKGVIHQLRHSLWAHTGADQRRIMSGYGVEFKIEGADSEKKQAQASAPDNSTAPVTNEPSAEFDMNEILREEETDAFVDPTPLDDVAYAPVSQTTSRNGQSISDTNGQA